MRDFWGKPYEIIMLGAFFMVLAVVAPSFAESLGQRMFSSPEEAAKALISALKSKNAKSLEDIFGAESEDLLSSGDPVADEARREKFVLLYEQKHHFKRKSEVKVFLYVGKEDWPFPIPIVKHNSLWHFDDREGREEILARRRLLRP